MFLFNIIYKNNNKNNNNKNIEISLNNEIDNFDTFKNINNFIKVNSL